MKILLITEKFGPNDSYRDGGSKLVETLQRSLGHLLNIMQFGTKADPAAKWHFQYPFDLPNRFEKRIANANFIQQQIKQVAKNFTNIIFVHISMQFGFKKVALRDDINVWTFPMFLTPSYIASGEIVPDKYIQEEKMALVNSNNIVTPSYLEKKQLIDFYLVQEDIIHVIPRGVEINLLNPKVRNLIKSPIFCSLGSIKPQKNTIGLIQLFAKIYNKFPEATLKIIGPVQNASYFNEVISEIKKFGLDKFVSFTGYVKPNNLAFVMRDAHFHISTSLCETFGRAIFETMASGLPNLIMSSKNNAAIDFLRSAPYVKFIDNHDAALNALEEMFTNFSKLSSMALEVGKLYDEEIFSKLLVAKICEKYDQDNIRLPVNFDNVFEATSVPTSS